ncbi:MAG: hypothetical protein PHI06_11905, partial [Desulfobulbaceae bacterium]|nr:hypothetical protein [Desulfobulbaceae bacterium]
MVAVRALMLLYVGSGQWPISKINRQAMSCLFSTIHATNTIFPKNIFIYCTSSMLKSLSTIAIATKLLFIFYFFVINKISKERNCTKMQAAKRQPLFTQARAARQKTDQLTQAILQGKVPCQDNRLILQKMSR